MSDDRAEALAAARERLRSGLVCAETAKQVEMTAGRRMLAEIPEDCCQWCGAGDDRLVALAAAFTDDVLDPQPPPPPLEYEPGVGWACPDSEWERCNARHVALSRHVQAVLSARS